jgi:iron complex transport system substrate-binding protein
MSRLVAALLLCLAFSAQALQITDDRGVTVTLPAPAAHRQPAAVADRDGVRAGPVPAPGGVDRYSNFPASVRALPQVGGGMDPSIEAVVALKPDVVLMATSSRAGERLAGAGHQGGGAGAQDPCRRAQRVLEKVGAAAGCARRQRVWRVIDAGVSAAAQSLPAAARNTRVYFEVSSGPYAPASRRSSARR